MDVLITLKSTDGQQKILASTLHRVTLHAGWQEVKPPWHMQSHPADSPLLHGLGAALCCLALNLVREALDKSRQLTLESTS